MKTIVFLATLVAVLTFNGCYDALTGCPGSAQCDPNWEDGSTSDGNSNSVDGGSSTEQTKYMTPEESKAAAEAEAAKMCPELIPVEGHEFSCSSVKDDPHPTGEYFFKVKYTHLGVCALHELGKSDSVYYELVFDDWTDVVVSNNAHTLTMKYFHSPFHTTYCNRPE